MKLSSSFLLCTLFLPSSILASSLSPAAAASTLSLPSASSASPSIPTSPTTTTTYKATQPAITANPSLEEVERMLQMKYHMTTYWSCVTIATQVHCGWHEPVLPGGDEIAAAPRGLNGRRVAGIAAGAMVVGAFLR